MMTLGVVLAFDEQLGLGSKCGPGLRAQALGGFLEHSKGCFMVQGAGLALRIEPAPVVQAEGGVAGLLDLQNDHPASQGVDRAGGHEVAVACLGPMLNQACWQVARLQGLGDRGRVNARLQAQVDDGLGSGFEDQPGLGLSALGRGPGLGVVVVGMDLDRKILAGVEELDEQGKTIRFRSKQFLAAGSQELAQRNALEGSGADQAGVQGMIAEQPGFTDRRLGNGFGPDPRGQLASAPGHGAEERSKRQWIKRRQAHHLASSANGWIGPCPLGLGRDLSIASAS